MADFFLSNDITILSIRLYQKNFFLFKTCVSTLFYSSRNSRLRTDIGGCSINSGTPGFRSLKNNNYQLKSYVSFILDINYILYQMK